jgi:hypothetical protein
MPQKSFKQVPYMERYRLIGKQTCIRNFMDPLDIISTYLPLFPPLSGEVMKELSNMQKGTILYDALPHYYVKKMKEDNTEPIEMSVEALFKLALNIQEAAVNPRKASEGNARGSKEMKTKTTVPPTSEEGGWKTQR